MKPFALLLLPFMLKETDRRGRFARVFAVTLALLYVPPLVYRDGYRGWRETARTYASVWEANGSVYELVTRVFGERREFPPSCDCVK